MHLVLMKIIHFPHQTIFLSGRAFASGGSFALCVHNTPHEREKYRELKTEMRFNYTMKLSNEENVNIMKCEEENDLGVVFVGLYQNVSVIQQ